MSTNIPPPTIEERQRLVMLYMNEFRMNRKTVASVIGRGTTRARDLGLDIEQAITAVETNVEERGFDVEAGWVKKLVIGAYKYVEERDRGAS